MVSERTSDALDSFWNSSAKATASIVACRLEVRGGIYEDACFAAMMLEAKSQQSCKKSRELPKQN